MLFALILFIFVLFFEAQVGVEASLPLLQWINYNAYIVGDRPPPRYDFAMGYDARRKFVYIFGGRTAANVPLDDTWILEVSSFTWRRPVATLTTRPPARYAAVAGMDQPGDQSRDSFVVGLGEGQAGAFDDIWSLDLNNEQWFAVTVNGTGPGRVAGAVGGVDITNKDPTQSLVVVGGVGTNNGGGIDGDERISGTMNKVYSLTLTGNWVRQQFYGQWTEMPLAAGSELPSLRRNMGGAVTSNSRVAVFGGCTSKALVDCPIQAASILSFHDQITEVAKRGAPTWSPANDCFAPRFSPTVVKSPNTNYQNQFFVYGGAGSPLNGNGANGEVGLLDGDTGMWSILKPAPSKDNSGYPSTRYGARMITTTGVVTLHTSVSGSDIILFGGYSLDPNKQGVALQDTWILRVFDKSIESSAGQVKAQATDTTDGVANAAATNATTAAGPPLSGPAVDGGRLLDQTDGSNINTQILGCPYVRNPVAEHAIWMTSGVALLPIAISVMRYTKPIGVSPRRYYIIYGLLMLASLGFTAYGIIIAILMLGGSNSQQPFGHLRVIHSIVGLILLILAWIFIPLFSALLSVIIGAMRRRAALIAGQDVHEINFDEYSQRHLGHGEWTRNSIDEDTHSSTSANNDYNNNNNNRPNGDNDNNEDNEDGGGGFQVLNRPGSQRSRRSIPSAYGGFARTSIELRRDSYRFNPVNTLAALYAQQPVPDAVPTFGPDNPHPGTLAALQIVTRWRRIHHLYSHLVFLALQLVVLVALFVYVPSLGYFGGYLGFVLAFYVAWIVAAWFGYPRRSLLASLLHMVGGRGHPPSRTTEHDPHGTIDPYGVAGLYADNDKAMATATYGRPSVAGSGRARLSVDPITAAAMGLGSLQSPLTEDQDEDDSRRQERMEQEMAGRDVVIMTIPKRRLTVVNA
ncbi:hypothetical protein BDF19DRAFT_422236 [Syncephalis fuscata]|nr:hypothetical protein BDF19DRAFT_422236 [Syncephalis fuscata]